MWPPTRLVLPRLLLPLLLLLLTLDHTLCGSRGAGAVEQDRGGGGSVAVFDLQLQCPPAGSCGGSWSGTAGPHLKHRLADALRRVADTLLQEAATASASASATSATTATATASATASAPPAASRLMSALPAGTTQVLLNIGSSANPLLPSPAHPHVATLAFEPILEVADAMADKYRGTNVAMVAAAVGTESMAGLQVLTLYNEGGESSSLRTATAEATWNNNTSLPGRMDGQTRITPTLSLRSVLKAIPLTVGIPFMKTDMQGLDLEMLRSLAGGGTATGDTTSDTTSDTTVGGLSGGRSGGRSAGVAAIRRIGMISSETWLGRSTFAGSDNDLCRDWLPLMTVHCGGV